MVDLFASEYGWDKTHILNHVYIDEYFIQQKIIDKRRKEEYLMNAHIQLLPHRNDDDRKKFFEDLMEHEKPDLTNVETDFEAIEKAKNSLK